MNLLIFISIYAFFRSGKCYDDVILQFYSNPLDTVNSHTLVPDYYFEGHHSQHYDSITTTWHEGMNGPISILQPETHKHDSYQTIDTSSHNLILSDHSKNDYSKNTESDNQYRILHSPADGARQEVTNGVGLINSRHQIVNILANHENKKSHPISFIFGGGGHNTIPVTTSPPLIPTETTTHHEVTHTDKITVNTDYTMHSTAHISVSTSPTTLPTTPSVIIPTTKPAIIPTTKPAIIPTTQPAIIPTTQPAIIPTTQPAIIPTTHHIIPTAAHTATHSTTMHNTQPETTTTHPETKTTTHPITTTATIHSTTTTTHSTTTTTTHSTTTTTTHSTTTTTTTHSTTTTTTTHSTTTTTTRPTTTTTTTHSTTTTTTTHSTTTTTTLSTHITTSIVSSTAAAKPSSTYSTTSITTSTGKPTTVLVPTTHTTVEPKSQNIGAIAGGVAGSVVGVGSIAGGIAKIVSLNSGSSSVNSGGVSRALAAASSKPKDITTSVRSGSEISPNIDLPAYKMGGEDNYNESVGSFVN
ncbi:hypothetical protein ACR3K2_19550 [Cryptosporidium serpentis]